MSLSALAKAANMTASKAHKYLASFVRAGLVVQDSRNGFYRLGPLALELGLTAIRNLNVVDIAESTMLNLRDALGVDVSLAVWANQGPTIVRRVENHDLQFVLMRIGTVLPLLSSANGRVFLAYLDRRYTHAMIDAELKKPDGAAAKVGLHSWQDVEEFAARIRANRVSEVEGIIAGYVGMSAPIFDVTNNLAASLNDHRHEGRRPCGAQAALVDGC